LSVFRRSTPLGSAVSYTGTDTSNPIGAIKTAGSSSGNPSINITTTADNSIIDDNANSNIGTSLTVNSPEIQQANTTCTSNITHAHGTLQTTTAGSYTVGWTAGASNYWAEIAVEIKGGPATQTTLTTNNSYAARVDEGGQFNSYSFTNNTWTMYDKKGNKYTFGSDDTGRMYDTNAGTSTNTYRWMLQEIRDTNGNYVKYTYNRDSNVLYPYQIVYTGNGSADGPFIVSFATSTRTDTRTNYAPGFPGAETT
jgi:Salmonella virulence plasmid 65kDa B protein